MSREQKLGLIAGFTVVLLFGVLLADHLSRARTEPLLISDPVDQPLVIPELSVPARVGSSALPTQPRIAVSEPMVSEPSGSGLRVNEPATMGGTGSPRIATGEQTLASGLRSIFEPVSTSSRTSAGLDLPGFDPVASRQGSIGGEARSEAPAERVRTHEVKRGDSLFAISERYYGNGHLWRELASHNRGKVDANGGVAIGVVLTIPDRGDVSQARGERIERGRSVPLPVAEKTYTVQSGDTLSEISQKLLGSAKRMDELLGMNRDQIRDADDIRVGMRLRYRAGPSA